MFSLFSWQKLKPAERRHPNIYFLFKLWQTKTKFGIPCETLKILDSPALHLKRPYPPNPNFSAPETKLQVNHFRENFSALHRTTGFVSSPSVQLGPVGRRAEVRFLCCQMLVSPLEAAVKQDENDGKVSTTCSSHLEEAGARSGGTETVVSVVRTSSGGGAKQHESGSGQAVLRAVPFVLGSRNCSWESWRTSYTLTSMKPCKENNPLILLFVFYSDQVRHTHSWCTVHFLRVQMSCCQSILMYEYIQYSPLPR